MKILRYALMIAAAFAFTGLVSCSHDSGNGADNAKIGFSQASYSFNETAGLKTIALAVTGEPKEYPISFDVKVSSVDGSKPDSLVHFTQTENLKYEGDTLSPVFVEFNILDNKVKSGDQSFTLTITNVKGATVADATTTVTIVDDETTAYDRLQGDYTFNATNLVTDEKVSFPVKVSAGYSDDEIAYYSKNNILVCWGMSGIQNETPESQNFSHQPEWYMGVSVSAGTLEIIVGQQMTDTGSFTDINDNAYDGYLIDYLYSGGLYASDLKGEWSSDYKTITFDQDYGLAIMIKGTSMHYYAVYAECSMTKVE